MFPPSKKQPISLHFNWIDSFLNGGNITLTLKHQQEAWKTLQILQLFKFSVNHYLRHAETC